MLVNMSALKEGIDSCSKMRDSIKDLSALHERAQMDMLPMVDMGRRTRQVYLKSENATDGLSSNVSPLNKVIDSLNTMYDDLALTNNYVKNLVECSKLDKHNSDDNK